MAEENVSWKKGVAELVGTFALIFVGVLVLTGGMGAGGDGVAIALAHGLTIAVMVSATMMISGGQLNPAVTIGLMATKRVGAAQGALNVLMQIVGGVLGGFIALFAIGGGAAAIVGGVPDLGAGVTTGRGILIEAVLTFILMFVIYGTAVDGRLGQRLGGMAIGLAVTLDILAGGPLTGAAMNPARWLGAAIPAGHYANAIVYFVGPILGALAAAFLYEHVLIEKKPLIKEP